jgi:diguanylate cyclase (GGDEF)-like protein
MNAGFMMRRWGLTATFAAVSLFAMAAVGTLLILAIGKQAREYALDEAIRTAQAYVTAGVLDVASVDSLTGLEELPARDRAEIEELATVPDDGLRAIRLWTADSQLVFGTDSERGRFPDGLRLDAALTGQPAPKVVDEIGSDGRVESRLLSVYLPVGDANGGTPSGAAEIVLDYTDTEAAVSKAVRLVAVLVIAGLGLLWLLLFRTVSNASRRLRSHATENAKLALLDPLTSLPNRRLLSDRIDRAVTASKRSGMPVGLLLLDVDGFKEVNDTLGHDFGDRLLVEVATRVRSVARETDTVARLGGDEFAVLMPVVADVDEATASARRVLNVFNDAFVLGDMTLHVDASLGVALLPDHADDEMTLLRHADVAMYAAKRANVGFVVYSPEGDHHSAKRLTLTGDLRRALMEDDQLSLHYQPKIDLGTGRVAGFEALLRWIHPEHGPLSPADFIPLAEQTGLVSDLTQWVLEQAVGQLADWEGSRSDLPLDLAVNLSARNLHESNLSGRIRQLLHDARVSPASLELEITESAIPADAGTAQDALGELSELGISLAIDDFGIGNTSINQLRSIPLRTLKIDRSFITPLTTDPGSIVLARAVIDLAHEFDLVTVAEGVEDINTALILRELGCDLAQGFLWSAAVPAADIDSVTEQINAVADDVFAVTSGSAHRGRLPHSP